MCGYTGPSWCALQKKLVSEREAGIGYEPECVEDGKTFAPRQCDKVYCWCVSENGREIPSTCNPHLVKTTSCDSTQIPLLVFNPLTLNISEVFPYGLFFTSICKMALSLCFVLAPQCPLVFSISTSHGAILCGNDSVVGKLRQRCEVFCDQGYVNSLPAQTFLCDPVTRIWLSEAPLAYSCQSKI